jgi:malate dehydrogenase (decarboxylating)
MYESLTPPYHMFRIREITAKVAAAVVKEAVKEDNSEGYRETNARELRQIAEDEGELLAYVEEHMWSPEYSPLVSPHSY